MTKLLNHAAGALQKLPYLTSGNYSVLKHKFSEETAVLPNSSSIRFSNQGWATTTAADGSEKPLKELMPSPVGVTDTQRKFIGFQTGSIYLDEFQKQFAYRFASWNFKQRLDTLAIYLHAANKAGS